MKVPEFISMSYEEICTFKHQNTNIMMKLKIIGLMGLAGVGKDTVAKILEKHSDYLPVAFASALRQEVAQAFDVTIDFLLNRETKETPTSKLAFMNCKDMMFLAAVTKATHAEVNREWLHKERSPREVMQLWGTEYRRAGNEQYWLQKLTSTMMENTLLENRWKFVITDVRFANEVDYIRIGRGELWEIRRPGQPNVENGHASQVNTVLFNPDVVIMNSGSLEELEAAVTSV